MCTGLEIGALAAAAAGTATEGYAQNQTLKKQDQIAAQGIVQQGATNKQAESDVAANVNKVAQSNASTAAAQAKQLAAYRSALQQGQGISQSSNPNLPGGSKAYKDATATAGSSAQDYVQNIAKSAATTQGTQLERVQEGQDMGDTASKLGVLSGQSQEQNYLTKLQIASQHNNPWLMGLGEGLQGLGAGMGAAAGVAGGAADAGANASLTASGAAAPAAAGFTDANGFMSTVGGAMQATPGAATGMGAGIAAAAPGAAAAPMSAFGGISNYLAALNSGRTKPGVGQ